MGGRLLPSTAMALHRAWACLFLAGPCAGLQGAGDDVNALVQSAVTSHSVLGRAASGLGGMLDAALGALRQGLPEAGVQSSPYTSRQRIALNRFEGGLDSRAAVLLDATTSNCDRDCELAWGENVTFHAVVRAPGAFKTGDILHQHLSLAFDVANLDSPFSAIFAGQTISMHSTCEFCTGSCKIWLDKENGDFMDLTTPTKYIGQQYCKKGVSEIVIADHNFPFPNVDAAGLKLSGVVNASVSLYRKGSNLASSMMSMDFLPVAGTAEEVKPQLLQVSEDTSDEIFPESVNAIVAELTVDTMENSDGSNISIVADSCESKGNSTKCMLTFGSTNTMDLSLHLSSVFDPSFYMVVSMSPKVSGPIGAILSPNLAKITLAEFEMPMCTESEEEDVFSYQAFGEWHGIVLPRCGLNELNVVVTGQEFSLPRVVDIPFAEALQQYVGDAIGHHFNKFIGADLNHMPPASVEVKVKLMRQGAVPVFDARLKWSLEKVKL